MMSGQGLALDVTALFAGYGRFDVVRDIALKVGAGEAVALLGPNGAGKTTVLKAIMGLVSQRRGSIRVAGEDVSAFPAHQVARGFAAIAPEGRRLFLDQTVEDKMFLGGLHKRRERARHQRGRDPSQCARAMRLRACARAERRDGPATKAPHPAGR